MKVLGMKMSFLNIVISILSVFGIVHVLNMLGIITPKIEYMTGGHGENSHNPDGSHNFSDPVPTLN